MKRVLIVAYYWPPSGGGGVQRWLKFSKYLPSFGWKPIVVTPENPEVPVEDQSLIKDVNPDVEVLKLPIFEPYGIFKRFTGKKQSEKVNAGTHFSAKKQDWKSKLSLWLRGNILLPDPRVFWVNPTAKYIIKHIEELNPDVIITTGTPHSMHLIGLRVKKKFPNIPWLVDFRDPWSDLDNLKSFYASKWAMAYHKRKEKQVLQKADCLLTVSPTWAELMGEKVDKEAICITNGFEPSDVELPARTNTGKFIIAHVGIINSLRNPLNLWKGINTLLERDDILADKFELHFAGTVENDVLASLERFTNLKKKLVFHGYVNHKEVAQLYANSDVLLVLLNDSNISKGHIPGKVFECLASGKKVISVGNKQGDAAKILQDAIAEQSLNIDFADEIEVEVLKEFFQNEGKAASVDKLSMYTRESLTEKLATQLNKLIS